MPGYREFMPGQVWFYYNAAATKDLERKKELGALTSRPVVIVQNAFYPEWNDCVTVCPMTSSDRRSGVYIETTLLKDGSMVEGGTVLPYILYTIKTKYLYPVLGMNGKRKMLSLSDEDFQKVMEGVRYHLGFGDTVPEYVENWKHVSDYDREIIIRELRLAVHISEGMTAEGIRTHNPILSQTPAPDPNGMENHIIATLDRYDRGSGVLYSSTETQFTETPLGVEAQTTPKVAKKETTFQFCTVTPKVFVEKLQELTETECFPTNDAITVFPESTVLKGVELANMESCLTRYDELRLCAMTMKEIMHQTGIASSSTASRLRMKLRGKWKERRMIIVRDDGSVEFTQNNAPENFRYLGELEPNRSRARRSARRRKALFQFSKEELLAMIGMSPTEIAEKAKIPGSSVREFRNDICLMFPDAIVDGEPLEGRVFDEPEPGAGIPSAFSEGAKDRYLLYETLSTTEIHEIRSCSKRTMQQTAKQYGISKERFRNLHDYLLTNNIVKQVDDDIEEAASSCQRIARNLSAKMTPYEIMLFCRSDYAFIAEQYSKARSANTPGKSEIRKLKAALRKGIVTDFRQRGKH